MYLSVNKTDCDTADSKQKKKTDEISNKMTGSWAHTCKRNLVNTPSEIFGANSGWYEWYRWHEWYE